MRGRDNTHLRLAWPLWMWTGVGLLVWLLSGCCSTPTPGPATVTPEQVVIEQPVTPIPLTGPLTRRDAEVSGLAWYGDALIILPQYPDFSGRESTAAAEVESDGLLFALSREEIVAFLDGVVAGPLEPRPIPLYAPGLEERIPGYQGYEAIALADGGNREDGARVFFTIEAETDRPQAYLLAGEIAPDLSAVTVDVSRWAEIPSQSGLSNQSEEALVVVHTDIETDTLNRVVTIHEANGLIPNPQPMAHIFRADLSVVGTLPFPNIEYRVTDATAVNEENRFWVINYFYPGDHDLDTADDPLTKRYGQGATHARRRTVERLVELQYTETGIVLVERPPLTLELGEESRNWEGIARLDGRGFLLMTDKFPSTILVFIAEPVVASP